MATKKSYRLLRGTHRTGGKVHRAGADDDTMELSKNEVEALGDRIEPAGGRKRADEDEDTATNAPESEIDLGHILTGNVTDIKADLARINSQATLNELQRLEIEGKGRDGVFRAIEARREELTKK